MSGGWKQAKLAGRRPLDGRVRLLRKENIPAALSLPGTAK